MYMYVGQWPTFYGPVILSYILKTSWWRNVVLKILIHCDIKFDLQIYVGHWPIFCVTVILPFISNTTHSRDIGSDVGHLPVFHDIAVLNHLPISAYSGLLKFDLKIFVNIARL